MKGTAFFLALGVVPERVNFSLRALKMDRKMPLWKNTFQQFLVFLASLVKVSVQQTCAILSKQCPLCQPMLRGCSTALLCTCCLLTQEGSLWCLRNSHVMGVGDLMDSPCEQGNTEQILTKLAFLGNGEEYGWGPGC